MIDNNFKILEREQEAQFRENTNRVNKSLKSNLKALGFFGNLIDLYVTKALGFFAEASGGKIGDQSTRRKRYPNQ